MKYKLIGNNDYDNPIETILNNRGVKNKNKFLKPNNSVDINYSKLKNINRAVCCLIKHIKQEEDTYVQVDSDP